MLLLTVAWYVAIASHSVIVRECCGFVAICSCSYMHALGDRILVGSALAMQAM